LNGLYDAKLDSAPVLAITGQTYHDLMGMHYQQEVDLLNLFKDVAVFNQQVMGPARAHALVDAACRAALGARGVARCHAVSRQDEGVVLSGIIYRPMPHSCREEHRPLSRYPIESRMDASSFVEPLAVQVAIILVSSFTD
jgi:hypothetical protein